MNAPTMRQRSAALIRDELVQQVNHDIAGQSAESPARPHRRSANYVPKSFRSLQGRAPRAVVLLSGVAVAGVLILTLGLSAQKAPGAHVLHLGEQSSAGGACAPLNDETVAILRHADVAFSARVTAVSDDYRNGTVMLAPEHFYRGGSYSEVRLQRPPMEGDFPLAPGNAVLISAIDGKVLGCVLSGSASTQLERYYQRAYE